jgi:signal transduction histidine kinase
VPGLARRGQALAGRQLQLLEELAREEPDPQRRRALAGVEHLARRLRRGAETLLAVTGPDPSAHPVPRGTTSADPVPVPAVLRVAVAEAEPGGVTGLGNRVELGTLDEVEVDGRTGGDLVHLLAELLDNAAAFSPPAAPVLVTGKGDGDGYLIEVADRGLGMTGKELAWANQRLAGDARAAPDPPGNLAKADRLGLLVVGRLAGAHGLAVRLGPSPEGGVSATVRLPAALLSAPLPAPPP